ncbi:hypothetical protein L596_016020 [Steinernema carpocapsae]|uniref:Uncharacterized protein n=1 Tax=Steinernema carpocapsae TaxID=34508 RepID=A0A4U5NHD0_STECR|nr:hypothetical protein L596_016020 [Steinernema carpocapsae]
MCAMDGKVGLLRDVEKACTLLSRHLDKKSINEFEKKGHTQQNAGSVRLRLRVAPDTCGSAAGQKERLLYVFSESRWSQSRICYEATPFPAKRPCVWNYGGPLQQNGEDPQLAEE